ncbi:MAG: hypothetical protein IJ509_00570 [Bacilli bacterium]|nr:hypothetical protein [Bacilli bacterium]
MKNKKKLFIISGLFLILTIVITIIVVKLINTPKEIDNILTSNGYELQQEFKKGTKGTENYVYPRNTYIYQKGEIVFMVYEYDSLDEIKEEVLATYDQEIISTFDIDLDNEDNYIYKKSCDNFICLYNLGYKNELVSTIVDVDMITSTDEMFEEIIKNKKL